MRLLKKLIDYLFLQDPPPLTFDERLKALKEEIAAVQTEEDWLTVQSKMAKFSFDYRDVNNIVSVSNSLNEQLLNMTFTRYDKRLKSMYDPTNNFF